MNCFQVVDVPDHVGRQDVLEWTATMLASAPEPRVDGRFAVGGPAPALPKDHPYQPVLTEVRRVR